uniref:Uncharacterized protein n=1 Tax=Solanum lycopersicum TaxID=4081 RepID=A0A3Q7G463_SOLLC
MSSSLSLKRVSPIIKTGELCPETAV